MNKHIGLGRLTRDPELRYTQTSNKPVARFTLAIDRQYKREGQPEADFLNYVCFDRQAEFVEKYLQKGTKVLVESRPQNNHYTKQDGTQVYGMDFIVEHIEFAESRGASGEQQQGGTQQRRRSQPAPASYDGGFQELTEDSSDEELPF